MPNNFTVPDGYEKMEASPTWDYKVTPVFEGSFISTESNVGPNHSNLYTFRVKDGSLLAVWGNTILDTRFKNLEFGELVIIHYLGKVKSEKRKGAEYHNFEVYHRMPEEDISGA